MIFSNLFPKKDEFLEELKKNQELYQKCFNKLLATVDDEPYARYISGLPELVEGEYERENEKMQKIIKEAEGKGLNFVILFVVFLQYAKADVLERDRKKNSWMFSVLHRKNIDFFPDHNAIIHFIEKFDLLDYE